MQKYNPNVKSQSCIDPWQLYKSMNGHAASTLITALVNLLGLRGIDLGILVFMCVLSGVWHKGSHACVFLHCRYFNTLRTNPFHAKKQTQIWRQTLLPNKCFETSQFQVRTTPGPTHVWKSRNYHESLCEVHSLTLKSHILCTTCTRIKSTWENATLFWNKLTFPSNCKFRSKISKTPILEKPSNKQVHSLCPFRCWFLLQQW